MRFKYTMLYLCSPNMHIYYNMGQADLLMQLPSPNIFIQPTASALV